MRILWTETLSPFLVCSNQESYGLGSLPLIFWYIFKKLEKHWNFASSEDSTENKELKDTVVY